MLRFLTLAPALLAGLCNAFPQAVTSSCTTSTTFIYVPTKTNTFASTAVVTISETGAEDLGTFTDVTTLYSTTYVATITSTATVCTSTGTFTGSVATVYTTSGETVINVPTTSSSVVPVPTTSSLVTSASKKTTTTSAKPTSKKASTTNKATITKKPVTTKKATTKKSTSTSHSSSHSVSHSSSSTKKYPGNYARQDSAICTVTYYLTTTYGQTATYLSALTTSTYYDYTAYTQETVTSTKSDGTTYGVASATTTVSAACAVPTTVTQDARCAPAALQSAYNGFGLSYSSDTPTGGAHFTTTATDASACCQLCAEATSCAASLFDIRTNVCKLEFPLDYGTTNLNCGEGALVYYGAGPNNPLAPGVGLYVGTICGNVQYGNAEPDDGT